MMPSILPDGMSGKIKLLVLVACVVMVYVVLSTGSDPIEVDVETE